jgi:hypothetical protein
MQETHIHLNTDGTVVKVIGNETDNVAIGCKGVKAAAEAIANAYGIVEVIYFNIETGEERLHPELAKVELSARKSCQEINKQGADEASWNLRIRFQLLDLLFLEATQEQASGSNAKLPDYYCLGDEDDFDHYKAVIRKAYEEVRPRLTV